MVALVYMVAGMSSRFGGSPKSLCKVGPNQETLLEISLNQALIQDFSKIILITNPSTEYLFKQYFQTHYKERPIYYIQQKYDKQIRTRPWGTTDAVCCLHGIIDEPFLLLNGDDLYGKKAFETAYSNIKNHNGNIIGTIPVHKTINDDCLVNRGIVCVDQSTNKVIRLKEHLDISRESHPHLMNELSNVNFIGLQPNVVVMLNDKLSAFKKKTF